MSRRDTRYLKQRSDGLWLVQVAVPRALRKALGKDIIEKSARTSDHSIAVKRRDDVLPIIREAFDRAKRGLSSEPDLAFIGLWQELATRGFYRPQDGFAYQGQRYSFVQLKSGRTTWATRCGKCQRIFRFTAPGQFPPEKPPRSCGKDQAVSRDTVRRRARKR